MLSRFQRLVSTINKNNVASSILSQQQYTGLYVRSFNFCTDQNARISGKCKFFNHQKGWGIITGNDGNDYFAHFSALRLDGFKVLNDNEDVEFNLVTCEKTGKLRADNVTGPNGGPLKGPPQRQYQERDNGNNYRD